jgi:hypothetical protein
MPIKNYKSPVGRRCLCGAAAVIYKSGGFVCARCDAIERHYSRTGACNSSKRYTQERAKGHK